jgi:hypothetical protein
MQINPLDYLPATFNPPMSGKDLAERLGQMSPDARAVLALSLTRTRGVVRLTRAQASRLAEVSPYNIALASLATSDEREGLMHGRIKLSDVRKAHAHPHTPSDDEIVAFINAVDPDRVLNLLDRMTAPTLSVAAE